VECADPMPDMGYMHMWKMESLWELKDTPGTQPIASTRGSKKVIPALKKVDFFVTIDVMKTAEYAYADIVMPIASSYDTEIPFETTPTWIGARKKVIEPLGNYKSMHEFWLDLGVKKG